jgi:exopolyphosphatase/guanosine-5'-triphosphate,3'-diphosphate pyrophosphatase
MTPPPAATRREAAVIEIGSSSIRMAVARREPDGSLRHLDDLDLPVGLGRETLSGEEISAETTERCVAAIRKFQQALAELGVRTADLRVVATSAVREARNREAFTDRILIATGLPVAVLSEAEVSRLTYLAVRPVLAEQPFFRRGRTLVVEVGGGSTEILAFTHGRIREAHVSRIGSLRMRREIGDYARTSHGLAAFEAYLAFPVSQMAGSLAGGGPAHLVVLGGETRLVRDILLGGDAPPPPLATLAVADVRAFLTERVGRPVADLARENGLSEHQAEALLPALAVCVVLAETLGEDRLRVGNASLRDGVLAELLAGQLWEREFRRQTLHSARALARRYHADVRHAGRVAAACRGLRACLERACGVAFDPRDDTLLHVAALVHEIGMFVNARAYHKHTLYLVENSEIFGLDAAETALVARIARYHRRAAPRPTHEEFVDLPAADRVRVSKLAAILRVADVLDVGHAGDRPALTFEACGDELVIRAHTDADLTLAQGQMDARAGMFRSVFGLRVTLRAAARENGHAAG